MVRRAFAVASIAAALAGCSAPEHENPYDPQTPPALQARATLRGTVALERLGDVPPALEGVNVSVAGIGAAVTNAAGEWMLPEVPPGTYQVQTIKEGYETAEVGGVVVRLDDGGQDVWVAPIAMDVARGTLAGLVQLSAGAVDGFEPGTDLSGVVVTLSGTGVPLPAAVSDATGAYRFVGVPASVGGAAYTVRASRPFHLGAETTASVAANATTTAPLLTLVVNPAAATGVARLWDNVADAGANGSSAGVDVSLTGTAFNGTSFSKATTTLADGSFSLAPLPAGTYDVVAASPSRACGAFARVTVAPGGAVTLGAVDCVDAVAPGALVLGDPIAPAGGLSGYTRFGTVSVPIALQASDDTLPASNFAGYELFVGPVAAWEKATFVAGTPAVLTFADLAPDARNTLWARGIDWAGNAGPAAGVAVVQDGIVPPAPTISTPRVFVDATTTSVTLSGGEKDENFAGYQTCTQDVAATAACPVAPGCAFSDAPAASFALSLSIGQRTCLWARSVDRAGNVSEAASTAVVSDLQPPVGPRIAPLFDPAALRVHGEYVDFSITAPATDGPAGGEPWRNVAWIEVDAGNGFTPLCPSPACRPGGVYAPCDPGCGCTDRALLCRGAELVGIRLPLLGNRANEIAVRAVDLASNVGSGASQQVQTTPDEVIVRAEPGIDETPRVRGRLVVFASIDAAINTYSTFLTDMGPDGIWDPGDTTCPIAYPGAYAGPSHGEPISNAAIVYVEGARYVKVRRPGADGSWCTADDATSTSTIWDGGGTAWVRVVSGGPGGDGAKERAAWAHEDGAGSWRIYVREPGADGKLDGVGDATYSVIAATTAQVTFLRLAGDVLLYEAGGKFTALNAGAAGFSSVTSWALPTAAVGAGLSADGKVLAWLEGGSGTAVLKVKQAGANGDFEAADPEVSRTAGAGVYGADVAVEGGHVAAVENSVGGATYYVEHWYAGGDGAFGTADDTFARTLPSSRPRFGPTLSTGVASGRLYYNAGMSGYVGEDPDILATDLTATRWEVARDLAVSGPETNGAGTLFYRDEGSMSVCARTSDGRETCSTGGIWTYVADGNRLYTADGSTAWVSAPDANGQWFTAAAPAPVPFYSGFFIAVAARDGYVVGQTEDAAGGTTHSLLRWNGSSTSVVRLDDPARFPGTVSQHTTAWGMGVSAQHAVWGCLDGGYWRPCVRSAVNGVFGDGDDVSLIPEWPGAPGTRYSSTNLAVVGNRLVFVTYKGGADRLVVLDAGADRRFNTADDRETDLGELGVNARDALDVAGDFVAFADFVPGLGGTQVNLLDLRDLSRRTLTDWYSFKPEVRVDPSGRVCWLDQIFQAKSLFVWSP